MRASPEQLRELYRQMDPTLYESELEGRKRTAQKHLQIVRQFTKSGRLLDVGCASGLFLSCALEAGFEIAGVEPNEKLCEQALETLHGRGEIHCGDLESAKLAGNFRAITLWDVLEHVPDPLDFLRKCHALLQPNGLLFLNVPDLDSFEAIILGRRWPLLLPEHLNYFNRSSLEYCAHEAGFEPVKFGRRRAWFSTKYVACRVAQHKIVGARLAFRLLDGGLGRILVPISLGEIFAVCKPL